MAQTHEGAMKVLAEKAGESLCSLLAKVASGQKWCWRCKSWKKLEDFDADRSRYDGKCSQCIPCRRVKVRRTRIAMEDRFAVQKAHDAIRFATRDGVLPKIETRRCSCGNWAAHYHHHRGYKGHELEVIPLCISCHKKEHWNGI